MIASRFALPRAMEAHSFQEAVQTADSATNSPVPLMVAGSVLLVIVLIGLPWLASRIGGARAHCR